MCRFSSIIAAFLLVKVRNHQFERFDYFDFNEKKDIKINLFLFFEIPFGSICIHSKTVTFIFIFSNTFYLSEH